MDSELCGFGLGKNFSLGYIHDTYIMCLSMVAEVLLGGWSEGFVGGVVWVWWVFHFP